MPESPSPLDHDPLPAPGSVGLATLLASRQEGCGLPRGFYKTEALYAAELRRIWQSELAVCRFRVRDPQPRRFPDACPSATTR